MSRVALRVVAAALARAAADGNTEILIAQRPAGKWQAGRWEFPGGKIEAGETAAAALARELREELGIQVQDARAMGIFPHDYPDRSVDIALWLVTGFEGELQGLDGQALRWIPIDALAGCDLLEADLPMLAPLREALRCRLD